MSSRGKRLRQREGHHKTIALWVWSQSKNPPQTKRNHRETSSKVNSSTVCRKGRSYCCFWRRCFCCCCAFPPSTPIKLQVSRVISCRGGCRACHYSTVGRTAVGQRHGLGIGEIAPSAEIWQVSALIASQGRWVSKTWYSTFAKFGETSCSAQHIYRSFFKYPAPVGFFWFVWFLLFSFTFWKDFWLSPILLLSPPPSTLSCFF